MLTLSLRKYDNSMRSAVPKVLYKRFSERKYAEAFLEEGQILIRNLLYFRGVEGATDPRFDPLEGMYFNKIPDGTVLKIQQNDSEYITIGYPTSFTQKLLNPERFFAYCLSMQQHADQIEKFGKFLVTIHNPMEFINRICSGNINIENYCWGKVRYYDEVNDNLGYYFRNISEDGTPIWMIKPNRFSTEFEFRMVLETGDNNFLLGTNLTGEANFSTVSEWVRHLSIRTATQKMTDIASISTS